MNYTNIVAEIVAILQGITDINVVYDYEPKELLKYPAASVTASAHQDDFIDTHHNNRLFTFTVRLYYRTEDAQDSETILRGIVDQIIVAIENDVTLNGSCNFANPTSASWTYVEREFPLRVCELSITAQVRILR